MRDINRLKQEYKARDSRIENSITYSALNLSYLFAIQQRQRSFVKLLRDAGITTLGKMKILEIGSGQGDVIQELTFQRLNSSQLHGVELITDRVKVANERFPGVNFIVGDGQKLPYSNQKFDIVLQYTVFSSILDEKIKYQIANEMQRVVKNNGMIIWYDFWLNPSNPQTKGIGKQEIKVLFPNCTYKFNRITLAPPITRRIVPISWQFAGLLEKLTILNTHYLAVIKTN